MNSVSEPLLAKRLWWIYLAAAASLLITLPLPYVGEEAVYTITSLEMWASGEFFLPTLYGTLYPRPPLINWLIIPLAALLGWENALIASRFVTAAATVATGLALAWLTMNLTRNRTLAALAAAAFLSGDTLFYRGWLAYADSLFALCVFGAIACLWVAAERERPGLIWLGVLALTCGFLAKVQTAYLFYGVTAAVLFFARREYRRVLLHPSSLAAHAAALTVLVLWHVGVTRSAQSSGTLTDIVLKIQTADVVDYLNQLWWFPVETVLRFLPASGLAAYFWWRMRGAPHPAATGLPAVAVPAGILAWVIALNYLPYWLGPKTHIRYIMPLYPLIALLLAHLIWRMGEARVRVAVLWLAAAVGLKYLLALEAFPAYQQKFRGDYAATAADILAKTWGHELYVTDVSAAGLSVAAHLDVLRLPAQPLKWPPQRWEDGYVLSYTLNRELGEVRYKYQLGRDDLYLLCRGAACGERRDR
jgi:4-amino-4-deoxy-L-arabinose transferase-like glycosyltransferase